MIRVLSPRNKVRLLFILTGAFFFGAGLFIATITVIAAQQVLFIALFVLIVVIGFIGNNLIRCPKCNDKICSQITTKYWWMSGSNLFSAPCKRCGCDLDNLGFKQ
jgi:hypothetical protein